LGFGRDKKDAPDVAGVGCVRLSVDTKSDVDGAFGNDSVDTKSVASVGFGNDVDTKSRDAAAFDNYSVGFIRVRKRKLGYNGHRNTTSASYDLVRAVRVNGTPRHKFVLGLGSFKHGGEPYRHIGWFWSDVFDKMHRAGIGVERQHELADEMVRKGAPLITATKYRDFVEGWSYMKNKKNAPVIAAWINGREPVAA
jgi:hypothetical protein